MRTGNFNTRHRRISTGFEAIEPRGQPAFIAYVQTFGDLVTFNPHRTAMDSGNYEYPLLDSDDTSLRESDCCWAQREVIALSVMKIIYTELPKATSLEDIEALLPFREESETTKDVS